MKTQSNQNNFSIKQVFVSGLAMFAMFFGSGNLVFPLMIGKESTSEFHWGITGFIITGVILPFLGLIAILLYRGNYMNFFARLTKPGAFLLALFLLSLMGPFGVIPRCITVSYGSFQTLFPETPLAIFSFVMCGIVYLLSVRENKVVPLMGTVLAPAKFIFVGLILIFGLIYAPEPQVSQLTDSQAFESGITLGYQTMEIVTSFLFVTVIMGYLVKDQTDTDSPVMFKTALSAIVIGGGLMSVVYIGMVILGATYATDLTSQPEQYLATIAYLSLGQISGKVVTVAIVLSCLTTAIALATTFTDFVYEHVFQKRFARAHCLLMTILVSFVFSTFGFSGIAGYLAPILNAIYPLLIAYTLFNIGVWAWENRTQKKLSEGLKASA